MLDFRFEIDVGTGSDLIHLRESVFIGYHLRLKKENFATADDNG